MDCHHQTPTHLLPTAAHWDLQEAWTRVRRHSCVRLLHKTDITLQLPLAPRSARSVQSPNRDWFFNLLITCLLLCSS